ncbi:MAG: hypothetical protein KJ578_08845 [Bacteroidetes bacterium]|nr:hypothetical protein [Bacteroidota bacterium]MBU1580358.1 hypothetical protein [Bacteroidota bacterium]MBU2465232.1 hypothetical protein [Bacteroidota bacterium]MBU2557867.1 hypothetical protein [Bacteroidota bacterium]
MSEKWKSQLNRFITVLLRLSVISYLLYTLYPYVNDPGFENTFGQWTVRWILIILLGIAALMSFVVKRSDLLRYGFFLVLIAAAFNFFVSLLNPDTWRLLLLHTYVGITAIYYVSRDIRIEAGRSRKQRKKEPTIK